MEVNLPHTSQELDQATIAKGKGNNNVGNIDTAGAQIDSRKDESGESESTQTQRRRVGELALLHRPPETGLEFTTEGWEPGLVAGVDVGHWVPGIVSAPVVTGGRPMGVRRRAGRMAHILLS